VTVTTEQAPSVAAALSPVSLANSTVTVRVEVDVKVSVVVPPFDETAKFAGAAELIASELAPAAKLAGAAVAAPVGRCMKIVSVTVNVLVIEIVVVITVAVDPVP